MRSEEFVMTNDQPLIPMGMVLESDPPADWFIWDPAQIILYVSPNQLCGSMNGYALREELANRPILNAKPLSANVLDNLFRNLHLIPEEWATPGMHDYPRSIFFWETAYRMEGGQPLVRCLTFDGTAWCREFRWLCYDWDERHCAALRVSWE